MRYVIGLILCTIVLTTGCSTLAFKQPRSVSSSFEPIKVNLQPKGVMVEKGVACLSNLNELRIQNATDLRQAQFLDSKIGWVSSQQSIFRTLDGGQTWDSLKVEIPTGSRLASFFFSSPENGWVAMVSGTNSAQNESRYSSWLSVTNDGGKTWTQRQAYDDLELNVVHFPNAKTGFAAGSRMVRDAPAYPEVFVSRTNDGGVTWKDLSSQINNAIRNQFGKANDYIVDIAFTSPANVTLLTGFGKLVASSDSGTSWKQVTQFSDSRPQTGYQKLGFYQQSTIVLSGTISQEGVWGDLVVSDGKASWITYEINNLALFDVEPLAREELVVAGGAFTGHERSGSHYNGRLLPGVILRSMNGGESWLEIYRSKTNQPIVDIIKVSQNQIYAVGNDGTFVNFELQPCRAAKAR
ncbi:MAG TPA: hypothetical protein VFR78_14360 [Pyrinomonadaceae bacterium]|nr:hypothetical protein [Pyrinomonadaceae bacterium]